MMQHVMYGAQECYCILCWLGQLSSLTHSLTYSLPPSLARQPTNTMTSDPLATPLLLMDKMTRPVKFSKEQDKENFQFLAEIGILYLTKQRFLFKALDLLMCVLIFNSPLLKHLSDRSTQVISRIMTIWTIIYSFMYRINLILIINVLNIQILVCQLLVFVYSSITSIESRITINTVFTQL